MVKPHIATKEEAVMSIAKSVLGIETLETRRSDSSDFHDLAVWSIREALGAAFDAGHAAREAGGQ